MRVFRRKKRQKQIVESRQESWIRGLNLLVSKTQIKPNEISQATDIQLVEDGKIQCPRDGQAFYSGNWSDVSGYTYSTGLDANGVMAYDKLYIVNGVDPITYFDGVSVGSFTEISQPNAPTVTRTGTAGSHTFSYKITAVTNNGETTGSTAGSSTLNQAELDETNYMSVSWSTVSGAIGYNVYGRKDGRWYFMAYVEGGSSSSYVDKGIDTPNEAFEPPESNSTGGVIGKYICLYKDSLFVLGDPDNPSRLYYSGGGDRLEDFTVSGGGGFIDISKNDGQIGTGMQVFKDSLLVFKERSIYNFGFASSGAPQIQLVNPGIGCIAPRSIVSVENDVFFASEFGIYTIGNEAGFAFDVLRSNELSAKIRLIYQAIEPSRMEKISATYAKVSNKNLVIFAYTESGENYNNKAIVYDRERLAWYHWTKIYANCWSNFKDNNVNRVLYGDDRSSNVVEIMTGSTDFGTAIEGSFTLKSESFGKTNQYKRLKDIDLLLRQPTGSLNLDIIKDGVTTEQTVPLNTVQPVINFGHYTFGQNVFGESVGSGSITSQDENVLKTIKNLNITARSFGLKLSNLGGGSFTLLLSNMTAKPRSETYRMSDDIVNN